MAWLPPRSIARRLDTTLARTPMPSIYGRVVGRRLKILAYHDITDADAFTRQMSFLARECDPISLPRLQRCVRGEDRLPSRPVLVTFDDGHRSVMQTGLPILSEFEIPAVVFVVAGHLNGDRPLWWEEVTYLMDRGAEVQGVPSGSREELIRHLKQVPEQSRIDVLEALRASARDADFSDYRPSYLTMREVMALARAGIAIGNHTLTHPCLNQCRSASIRNEIVKAHEMLTAGLGRPPRSFSYPNGDFDGRAESVLSELGYEVAFLFDHRTVRWPSPNPLRLSRLRVDSTTSMDRFRLILSGLHSALHHAIGRS